MTTTQLAALKYLDALAAEDRDDLGADGEAPMHPASDDEVGGNGGGEVVGEVERWLASG
jgi:hypothetical protein